jgi:acyl carrier protein
MSTTEKKEKSKDQLILEVKNIVAGSLGRDVSEIADDSDFAKDLGVDSISQMELLMALEDNFEIKIKDEQARQLTSVESVVNFIKSS